MEFSTFCDMLQKIIPDPSIVVRSDSRLVDDLCLCSFDMMVILDAVERSSNTSICLDSLISVKTVQNLYDVFFKGGEKNG